MSEETSARSGEDADQPNPVPTATLMKTSKKVRRKRFRNFQIVTHRWLSLITGIGLLIVTTSGAVTLYDIEVTHFGQDAFDTPNKGDYQLTPQEAMDAFAAAKPDLVQSDIQKAFGVYTVAAIPAGEHAAGHDHSMEMTTYTLDPASGDVLGVAPAEPPTWMGFARNLHVCLLSCEDWPGYVPFMAKQVPTKKWVTNNLMFEGAEPTVSTYTFAFFALVLIYLCLTGLWLWFPRFKNWKSGFTVRWQRGRFARDTDLHKLIGVVALVFLLMWGISGLNFELQKATTKIWYALTPGPAYNEEVAAFASKEGDGEDISVSQAVAAATQAAGPGFSDENLVGIFWPAADDPTSTYTVYWANGIDEWKYGVAPGNFSVGVDRRTAETKITWDYRDEPAQAIWQSWLLPLHFGFPVNALWRIIWLIAGLTPVLLAWTGVSTWLVRRKSKKTR